MQPSSRDEPASGSATCSSPTHALIVGSHGAGWTSVEALDPATGLPLWAYEPHRELNAVAGAPGVVFVVLSVSHRTDRRQPVSIVALRARDGARLWWTNSGRVESRLRWTRLLVGLRVTLRQLSPTTAWWAMRSVQLRGDNTPLATDGDVLCVCAEQALFGFDAKSGRLRWVAPALNGQRRTVYSVRNGRVLVSGNLDYAAGGPGLEALDARTGRVLWKYQTTPAPPRFALDAHHVYTVANPLPWAPGKPAIDTLSAVDGTLQHEYPLRKPEGPDSLRLIADDGIAYFLHEGELSAVRLADERELWRMNPFKRGADHTGYPALSLSLSAGASLILVYRYVYRSSAEPSGSLRVGALDPHTGVVLWQWNESDGPDAHAGPATVQDAVYVRATDGIHALSAADGRELWHVPHGFASGRDPVLVALDG